MDQSKVVPQTTFITAAVFVALLTNIDTLVVVFVEVCRSISPLTSLPLKAPGGRDNVLLFFLCLRGEICGYLIRAQPIG